MKRAYKKRRFIWGAGIFVVLAALAVLGIYLFKNNTLSPQQWEELYATGTYHDGITIDGIDVGGMTMAQAVEAVDADMQKRLDEVGVTIDYNGKQFALARDDFEISDNIEAVVKEAFCVAREGSEVEKQNKIAEIKNSGLAFYTEFTVDTEPAKPRLSQIAAGIDAPAKDAQVQINKDDRENRFTYIDEQTGLKVDQEALYAAVSQQIDSKEYGTVKVPVNVQQPAVTKAELMANMVLRASASTSFKKSPYNRESRVNNIKKAVGLINGYALAPGEEFSTNTVLGPRTYSLGWEPAPAVVRGGSEDQAGGGVCQVSTTMYTAVLKADLEIVSRRGHSIKLGYVDGGLDATIDTNNIDFIYKNNTQHTVYIFCWVEGSKKKVNFEIYGEPFPEAYDEIRLSSQLVQTLKPDGEMLVTIDNTKAPGYTEEVVKRREGYIYVSYKHYYKDGKEVGEPKKIAETKYKPYAGESIVGPKLITEPLPTDDGTQTVTNPDATDDGTQPVTNPDATDDGTQPVINPAP